jgi:hypothetical protein
VIRNAAILSWALAFPAGALELQLPVDCTLGEDCYIQQYFDHDPGPGATDFTCGPLSYDGHDGTDFALPTRAAMEDGVAVLAAAPGKVVATRDGEADFTAVIPGRECGNGVVIDHGQGWQTQYCHLKQGSLLVQNGETVETGAQLGLIGQSGMAEFPHLHLSVRRNRAEVDPFSPEVKTCGAAGDDLWAQDLPFEPGGLLAIGISTAVPDFDTIKAGLSSPDLPGTAPALVVWASYFGPKVGDQIALSLTGPAGEVIAEGIPVERTQAMAFHAIGRKLTAEGWPSGTYEGTATFSRDGTVLDRMQISIAVGP